MKWPEHMEHPLVHSTLAPMIRVWQELSKPVGAGVVILAGVFQEFVADIFTPLAFMVLVSGLTDTLYGRRLHKILGDYDPAKAEIGLHGKLMGLALAVMIRWYEWWVAAYGLPDPDGWKRFLVTNGLLGVAVATTLFVQDLRSIQEKRERFGMPPIPVFSQIMKMLERLAEAMVGVPKPEDVDVQHRRRDDPRPGRLDTWKEEEEDPTLK